MSFLQISLLRDIMVLVIIHQNPDDYRTQPTGNAKENGLWSDMG